MTLIWIDLHFMIDVTIYRYQKHSFKHEKLIIYLFLKNSANIKAKRWGKTMNIIKREWRNWTLFWLIARSKGGETADFVSEDFKWRPKEKKDLNVNGLEATEQWAIAYSDMPERGEKMVQKRSFWNGLAVKTFK